MSANKFWEKYFGVSNLSSRLLSIDELTILGKGLKFCPTPLMVDHGKIKSNIDKFFRTCSLKLFFSESGFDLKPEREPIDQPFEHKDMKLASNFNPTLSSNLEHIYYLVIDELLSHNPK